MHNLITIYLLLIVQCTESITGNIFYKGTFTFMINFFSQLNMSLMSLFCH